MIDAYWLALLTAFVVSLGASTFLVFTQRWHGRLSLDHDLDGVQKIHQHPVPRIGGVAVALGLVGASLIAWQLDIEQARTSIVLMLCAIPAFGAGLLEDLTKRVSVGTRLIASAISGGLAAWVLNAYLTRLDTPGLDWLIAFAPLSMVFTSFAVSGVTNAVNITDGLNGLASGTVAIMLAGLGVIAWQYQDSLVLYMALIGIGACLGFMVLNFPFGKIFMGDGGAYLLGFWLAECAVLLLSRNPEISTWTVLLTCLYPVWETTFSMYRRNVVRKVSTGKPDMVHFHHLLLRRFVSLRIARNQPAWVKHSISSAGIWLMVTGCQFMAIASNKHEFLTAIGVFSFILIYQASYSSMVSGCQSASQSISPEMQVG